MEAAQRRPAGEPPPPLAHLPLQLAAELRLLRHSCAVIAQITPRPPCAPPSRVGAAPLDTKPSQTCTFLNKYLILKRRCGGTDALKPDRGPGLSSPPRSARSSRERSSSSEETSRHASGSVHSSSSLTAAPLASSGGKPWICGCLWKRSPSKERSSISVPMGRRHASHRPLSCHDLDLNLLCGM